MPTVTAVPQWTWTLTSENITVVTLNNLTPGFDFYYTTRPTGETAPTAIAGKTRPDDAIKAFRMQSTNKNSVNNQDEFVIESQVLIDVYTYSFSRDNTITTDGQLLVKNGQGNSLPVNPVSGGVDVSIQDQTTSPVEFFLTQTLNAVVINANAGARTKILELDPGHGFIIGNHIEIYAETPIGDGTFLKRFVQLYVADVNVNTLTVQPFIGYDLEPANVVFANRVSRAMNVNGSVTPVRFSIGPPNGLQWDLVRTMVTMVVTTNPDDALYGNLPTLANGVFFGFENDLGQEYLVNILANAGYRATAYDVTYTTRSSGGGSYGVSVRKSFAGREHYGVAIRLEGLTNDEFVAYVNDDFLLLTEHAQKVMGHNLD